MTALTLTAQSKTAPPIATASLMSFRPRLPGEPRPGVH
jgi:hypothetical protein